MLRQSGALLLFVLFALSTVACDDVKVNHDKTVDFSAYQTFAWKITDPNDKRLLERDFPKAAERIKAAINRELTDQGLQMSAAEDADLMVSYQVALNVKQVGSDTDDLGRTGAIGVPIGSTGDSGVWSNAAFHETVKKGTLVFSLVDRPTDKLVWQGQFSKKFRDPSDLEPADIRRLIERLFRDFPR